MVDAFMPFGKHRSTPIVRLPTGYLRWLLTGCNNLDCWLAGHIQDELQARGERYLPAADVLEDLEDEVAARLDRADDMDHDIAGQVGDILLEAFDAIRRRHRIGRETELHVPAARRN
jgi:hypothetical protein